MITFYSKKLLLLVGGESVMESTLSVLDSNEPTVNDNCSNGPDSKFVGDDKSSSPRRIFLYSANVIYSLFLKSYSANMRVICRKLRSCPICFRAF